MIEKTLFQKLTIYFLKFLSITITVFLLYSFYESLTYFQENKEYLFNKYGVEANYIFIYTLIIIVPSPMMIFLSSQKGKRIRIGYIIFLALWFFVSSLII